MSKDEKLLREFLRKSVIPNIIKEKKEAFLAEQKVRKHVRSMIKQANEERILETLYLVEAKDVTNPHPNTGINKLRDAIRKAKPSIKSKYQQLTTDPEQRESFTNHFLGAMIRMFDELDALNAQGASPEDFAAKFGTNKKQDELSAPPEDFEVSDVTASNEEGDGMNDLDTVMESILNELDIELDEQEASENDIVSDEFEQEDENEKIRNKSPLEKDFEKKQDIERKREEFSTGIGGDTTGRNQAFDAFNLVQSYFSDAYLDLNNPKDIDMFKKWGLYNSKLLLQKYEDELEANPEAPNIENPT